MKWLAHICSGLSNFSKTFENDFSTLLIIRNCLDPIERQRAKTFLLKAEKDKKKIKIFPSSAWPRTTFTISCFSFCSFSLSVFLKAAHV